MRDARNLLPRVVIATVAVQVAIVMSSLTVPVLAGLIAPAVGLPAYLVGYYSALVYGCAALTSLATPRLVRRWGGIRLHQGMLVLTAAALAALLPVLTAGFAVSAVLLGLAYGPMNPASTVLLARYTPSRLRGRVFSLKQTAVPAGGALAGYATPLLAGALGWRAAIATIAAGCLALAAVIQPWREELDREPQPSRRRAEAGWWLPLRVAAGEGRLRAVALAAFAFGALQFSFSAVFPTVLVGAGWRVAEAGMVLSTALLVGVVCRVIWGAVADRIGARPVLGMLGAMMSAAAGAAAFVAPRWPGAAIVALAALFGLSAFCWAGIGLAEAVHLVAPALVAEASAGIIAASFFGALAGPALFSTATALTGSFRPAFLILAALAAVPAALLLWPRRRRAG